jgi:hypothetical protein
MLTRLIILAAVLFVVNPVIAQHPCSRDVSDSPSIFGLRLGRPVDELSNVIGPTIKFKPKKTGEGSFFQNFIEQEPPPKLTGTRALYVRYFIGKIYQIEIFFEDKDQSRKIEDFTKQLSTDYQLPLDAWTIKNNGAGIDCGGFSLKADAILNRHIELTDVAAKAGFDKKKEAEKGSKRKS